MSFQGGNGLSIILGIHLRQPFVVQDDGWDVMILSYLERSGTRPVTDDNSNLALRDVLSIDGVQDRF
jgi:hypothetical protein